MIIWVMKIFFVQFCVFLPPLWTTQKHAGCDGVGAAQRSYPTSEIRGRSWEDPMPKQRWPRRVTPRPKSGAAAESTRLDGAGMAKRSYPRSEVGGAAERSYPTSEVRDGSREELPPPKARGGSQNK